MEHVFEILDQAKKTLEEIKKAADEGKIDNELLASWTETSIKLDEVEAKKLNELFERLVRLEDEVRGGKGPQAVPQ